MALKQHCSDFAFCTCCSVYLPCVYLAREKKRREPSKIRENNSNVWLRDDTQKVFLTNLVWKTLHLLAGETLMKDALHYGKWRNPSFWCLTINWKSGYLDICSISFDHYFWIVSLACPPPFFKCDSESLELPFNLSLMPDGWQKVNFSDPSKDFIGTSMPPSEVKAFLKRKTRKTFCQCNLAVGSISFLTILFHYETLWSETRPKADPFEHLSYFQ